MIFKNSKRGIIMSSSTPPAIEIVGLYKEFPGKGLVLKDINLQVKKGEFLVLLGPSGCGKSTLLRVIAGLEKATSGKVIIEGRVVNDLPPPERDVAMVFQSYALYPHMTVYENMAFALKLRGLSKEEIDRKVRQAAKMLGIEHHLNSKPKELSGGERQRVAVGRAIVRNPKVFLFDEPLSNLDARLRTQMRAEFKKLHRELRITTLYVTHDQVEAMTLGDRIAVMRDGRILQIGKPSVVYSKPSCKFVAGFIGNPPMNFIKGKFASGEGFVCSDFALKLEFPGELEGKEVYLGIRPEHLKISQEEGIEAELVFKEILGDEFIFHLRLGQQQLRLKTLQDFPGQRFKLTFPIEKLYFFDAASEELIYMPGGRD